MWRIGPFRPGGSSRIIGERARNQEIWHRIAKNLGFGKERFIVVADVKLQPGDRVKYKLQLGDNIPEGKHVGQFIHGIVVKSQGDKISVEWRHDREKVQDNVHPLDVELE